MRNLKKILAVITVIAMLASMMVVPALAEGFKYENEAKVLNDLGLMAGYGLGDEVNRAQGIVFALKAAGKAAEVEAMSDEEAAQILDELVVDKDQVPAWAVKWVAYAVKNGFTSGVDASVAPKVKFAPMQSMTAAELLVWLMNIGMGYKVGTDVSVSEAVNAGIITLSQAMEFGPKTALIRDDVAGILFGAAKNGVNADGKKFIESLIEAGFVSEEAAIAAGLIEPKPAKLEVVGVSATNLKQLVVEFNTPIKEAGNQDNYSIETDDAQATIDKDSKFNLQDDKKTVVITLTKAAAQNEVIDLKIKGIESESGLKLDETIIEDVKFEDTTLPKAVSAEVVGKYTIKVKFSEPIAVPDVEKDYDPADYFVVDDGDYIIKEIEKVNNDTELNIVLFSPLEEGTITVEAKPAIKDYAGYGITKKVFTVDVVKDETAPVIVGYKNAKPSEVTLIFDEDIKLLEEPDKEGGKVTYKKKDDFLAKFYHTNSNNPASDLKVDGKELTIKFGVEKKMTEGNTYIYIAKEVLQDLWENKNAKYSYVVDVTDDSEPPVVEKIEQESEEAIKVVFNEDVNDTALDLANYKVLDSKGEEKKDIIDSIKRDDDKTVIITFSEKLSGEYKLVVEKVEDVLENAMSKTTVAFTMKDKTAPHSTADNRFTAKVYNA
ncbi:MAG TPA: Ig-like domain-containing protein, partial [Thermoclostridium caenicola]|nr:Ig-like domain-containing protein [Thermoclostridium caenicola]